MFFLVFWFFREIVNVLLGFVCFGIDGMREILVQKHALRFIIGVSC